MCPDRRLGWAHYSEPSTLDAQELVPYLELMQLMRLAKEEKVKKNSPMLQCCVWMLSCFLVRKNNTKHLLARKKRKKQVVEDGWDLYSTCSTVISKSRGVFKNNHIFCMSILSYKKNPSCSSFFFFSTSGFCGMWCRQDWCVPHQLVVGGLYYAPVFFPSSLV